MGNFFFSTHNDSESVATPSVATLQEVRARFLNQSTELTNADINGWQAGKAVEVMTAILEQSECDNWGKYWETQQPNLRQYIKDNHWDTIFNGEDNGHIVVRTKTTRMGSAAFMPLTDALEKATCYSIKAGTAGHGFTRSAEFAIKASMAELSKSYCLQFTQHGAKVFADPEAAGISEQFKSSGLWRGIVNGITYKGAEIPEAETEKLFNDCLESKHDVMVRIFPDTSPIWEKLE